LKEKYPKLSSKTLLHLFDPPNISVHSASNYKSIIHARPYHPDNSQISHDKFHFCHAQVKLLLELFFKFEEESWIISCDNKNKISIGKNAVNRLNRAKRWYMKKDNPKLETHDFPKPFHIVSSGYLVLKRKTNNNNNINNKNNNNFETDQFGRQHVPISRSGNLYLFNRADQYYRSTIQSHMADLSKILFLEGRKDHLLLIVDRGPDNTWKGSLVNILQYGNLWKNELLTLLTVTGYAAEESAFNPVERAFSDRFVFYI
jgi:hypothetical protein